jgi:DNA-binding response OmpR family regulator
MTTESTILIVDDDTVNLKVLHGTLQNSGYEILIANSGERALYQIEHHLPDLILLDILMPGMDGFETCRRLKANPDTASVPIIFLTALGDVEHKIKGFKAGGVDYITKPFYREEVVARVNTHLTLYQLQQELKAKNAELEKALGDVKELSGLLPICSGCKRSAMTTATGSR